MPIVPSFHEAERVQCKASIMIQGTSGLGKSGLALLIGFILANDDWHKLYATDTENKSLNLFVGLMSHLGFPYGRFMKQDLTQEDGFQPSNYAILRDAAVRQGGMSVVIDSGSHMWAYKGGVLDMVSDAQAKDSKLNKWTAWGIDKVVREKNAIMDVIRSSKIHTIVTVRSKEKMEPGKDSEGKSIMVSLGEMPITMPEAKFEFDLVLEMLEPGNMDGGAPLCRVIKSRYGIFKKDGEYRMTETILRQIKQYLAEGTSPEELLEAQRQEYLKATQEYLDIHPTARTIWPALKENAGHKDTKLDDLPLNVLKLLYGQLIGDGE